MHGWPHWLIPVLPCVEGEWATGEPGRALQSWTGREAGASQRGQGLMRMSAQRDKQKLADGPTGRPTAFALSPGPKEGVTRTHIGPMERQQDHKIIFHPIRLCVCVSVLCTAFFFFKAICTKVYTSFADTGKIWINRAFL